jgi:hypothetical protein
VYFADLSMVIAGSFFQLSDFTLPAAAFSQGSGALLGAEALGLASALALDLLSSFLKTPVAYDTTLPTTITPRTDAITELRVGLASSGRAPLLLPQELLPGELTPPLFLGDHRVISSCVSYVRWDACVL